jgi:hypothetical protein
MSNSTEGQIIFVEKFAVCCLSCQYWGWCSSLALAMLAALSPCFHFSGRWTEYRRINKAHLTSHRQILILLEPTKIAPFHLSLLLFLHGPKRNGANRFGYLPFQPRDRRVRPERGISSRNLLMVRIHEDLFRFDCILFFFGSAHNYCDLKLQDSSSDSSSIFVTTPALTGLPSATKNYHMSVRNGKLKRCHGITETAACSMGHPFVPVQPEGQTENFQVRFFVGDGWVG